MSEGATVSGLSGILKKRVKKPEDHPSQIDEIEEDDSLVDYEELKFGKTAEPEFNTRSLLQSQDARQLASLQREPTRMIDDDQQPSKKNVFSLERIKNAAAKFRGGKDSDRDEAFASLVDCVTKLSQRLETRDEEINKQININKYGSKGVRLRITPPTFPKVPVNTLNSVYVMKLVDGTFPKLRFSGRKDNMTIREFLEAMNRGQKIVQLSEEDFKTALMQRCVGDGRS